MSSMNWVDLIVVAIFFFSMIAGLNRGFVKEVVSLTALIVAFFVASGFASTLANKFTSSASVQSAVSSASNAIGVNTAQPVSYAALGISFTTLFIITIIVGTIIGSLMNYAVEGTGLGIGNRLFGAAFGLGRGFIIVLVIMFLLQLTPIVNQSWWHQSEFVNAFQPAIQWLADLVSPTLANLKAKFGSTLRDVNSHIQSITNNVSGLIK